MSNKTLINVTRQLNTKAAKREKRNGRDVIIVPSATMPDNITMNKIKYPAEEIKKSYKSLERSPAPLDHPTIAGEFVSARDPEGINIGWIGAWNENVCQRDGRVFLDKVIDVQRANESEGGKRVLEAFEKGDAIHTSTGLYAHIKPIANNNECIGEAYDIEFDHDAILLDFEGAATPEQGVGIFVNSKGQQEKINVINSIWEDGDREMDWAVDSIARALEKKAKAPLYERIKTAITEAFESFRAETTVNTKDEEMSKEEIDKLSVKVEALTESIGNMGKTITEGIAAAFKEAMKPLTDASEITLANAKAQEEKERGELVDKVVKANLLNEDVAKTADLLVLRALANNIKEPGKAPNIRGNNDPGFEEGKGSVSKFQVPGAKKKEA